MRRRRPVGPTHRRQPRQEREWIAERGLDLPDWSAARHLSLQQRAFGGNGSRGRTTAGARTENNKEKTGQIQRTAENRRQVIASASSTALHPKMNNCGLDKPARDAR